ncbi:hypothetical protein [Saccharothrix sp. ST-888]|uniref:hypothetical protein n=1 Tax=Saccharothrix sp. ST-888 TaxID=1427391 RepID=UPI0005EC4D9A|nr:hypothetical protein [Saccharothrix sp. ST-888]KJK55501.1 hypothetical protein UK12_28190 [Saccharothrix sp. ST-888]
MRAEAGAAEQALRAPRAAAVAGIVFSLLLGAVIVLVRSAVPTHASDTGQWLTDPTRRNSLQVALNLVPFAGISFLWFMAVIRNRIGPREDRFFATVFLGSGLLLVAAVLADAAFAGGLLAMSGPSGTAVTSSQEQLWQFGRTSYELLTTYSMRMAAVFTLSVSTIGRRLGITPRWLAHLGYLTALVLLVMVSSVAWFELAFPFWALVVSIHILASASRFEPARTDR